jgi:predicted SprT family Zn-dependent metalloprotease
MSLIDKQLRAAKLQREFAIKIDEQAYKSFNGTRQSARNFRKGTLDIGKMGFDNTAEERITKEMITDYHKKEQDNIEKRLEGREKTTLHDTIEGELVTPRGIAWAATGRPATTADLMRVGDELNQKVNELRMYKEVIRTVPKKVAELEYYKNKSKLKRLSPEWMELQRPIMQYYADMKQASSEIRVLDPQ